MKTLIYQDKEIQLNYSTTLNHLIPHDLWQCGLSLPALGLAGYLYTLPKQWKLSVTHLSNQLVMSKNTCRKYLKEIFTNPKAREVFKVKEAEINTYDFDEGLIAYDHASDTQELENFTSSVAKDVSEPNRKRVLLIQTQQQRYLLNLCFKGMANNSAQAESNQINGARKACNLESVVGGLGAKGVKKEGGIRESSLPIQAPLSPLERTLSQTKLESSHTAKNVDSNPKNNAPKNAQILSTIKRDSKESLKDSSLKHARKNFSEYLDLKRFSKDEQEAIKFWITYKQESSKTKLKPAQVDFQLRKITRFKEQGQDICEIIERSLNHSWQGLFAKLESNPKILPPQTIGVKPKIPKNIGGKSVLRVENV